MALVYNISGLTKIYKRNSKQEVRANHDIDLKISLGGIIGIFGPNGAGKTTLIKQMAGLLKPTAGNILLEGVDAVKNPSFVPTLVAYCGQRLNHLNYMSPIECLLLAGRLRGQKKSQAKEQAGELLSAAGFSPKKDRLIKSLSGGELRTVSVLTSLMGNRPVIILDEPTASLDPVIKQNIWRILFQYQKDVKATIILVTHDVLEAERVVDEVVVINSGQVIAQGKPRELKNELGDEVRVEVHIKPFTFTTVDLKGWIPVRDWVFRRIIQKEESGDLINKVSKDVGIDNIEDIRIFSPSLEDYYVQKVGQTWH